MDKRRNITSDLCIVFTPIDRLQLSEDAQDMRDKLMIADNRLPFISPDPILKNRTYI
ncbi:MAG: hypothetical protein ACFFC3_11630 [Candidatus Odinarchaeota archaeon]